MKNNGNKKIVVFQLLVLTLFLTRCFALQDGVGNPTAPPSSTQSGLVRSPNPLSPSGNVTVTGNVSGMSYFHGEVPYVAPNQFYAPLGSESISSFYRLTAPLSSPTTSQFLPQPYYLPSSTVSTLAPSALGTILTYPSIRANKGTGDFVVPQTPAPVENQEITAASPLYDYSRTRPLNYEPTEMEKMVTYELMHEKSKEELSQALQKVTEEAYKPSTEAEQPTEPAKPSEPSKPLQPGEIPKTEAGQPAAKSVYEQMLEEIKKAQEQKATQPNRQPAEQNQPPQEGGPSELKSELSKVEKGTDEALVGVHKSFATQAHDKFNYYMRTAEEFLKEGKYYRAVDAYTLAGIYKPDNPLAYAGRAHALFAGGEYMSSAYFLTKAINIFPQYIDFKIDLHAMIPDANRLESRIADVKQWADKTNSPDLNFLLAYIYYQLGRTDSAMEAIKFAAEKMPDSVAVKALKRAIEKK